MIYAGRRRNSDWNEMRAAVEPRTRDANSTRKKIIKAATEEFSNLGFDGARVDSIAAMAGVSKNLIYIYFDNKEGLFRTVLELEYERMRVAQNAAFNPSLPPDVALEKFVRVTFSFLSENPNLVRLSLSENLCKGIHFKKSSLLSDMFDELPKNISRILEDGVRKEKFREGIDPTELYICISGMCVHHVSNQYTLSVLFDSDIQARDRRELRKEYVVQMIKRFVQR
jgi:AcrR family transcriptional regulator